VTTGTSSTPPTPRDELDPARSALLDAASAILAEEGPDGLTVRRIAARAGCSTMLVYSRLGGKQGIVEALYVEGFERLSAEMRASRVTNDPIADLRRSGRHYRKFALENPTYYAVMFDHALPDFEPSPDALTVASRTLDQLAALVQRAIDAGRFARGNARQLAGALWAANHGVCSLELKHVYPPDIDWPKCHEQVINGVLDGLSRAAGRKR
jgi:AcrR family transcriptional regulator